MARMKKPGIDYFSHDTDLTQDKKIKLLKAKHKLIGYAVYLRLLEEIYKDKGYFIQIDYEFNLLFSDDNNLDVNVYTLILKDCIELELFNKMLFEKHKILTSRRIQENYISAIDRRKEVSFIFEYMLVDAKAILDGKKINVNILNLNVSILQEKEGKMSTLTPKEKKRKEENSKKDDLPFSDENGLLPVEEKQKYISRFEEFWKKYPNKQDKKKSKAKFDKIIKSGEATFEEIMDGLESYLKSKKVAEGFIRMPMTWLNNENWADEWEPAEPRLKTDDELTPDEKRIKDWAVDLEERIARGE